MDFKIDFNKFATMMPIIGQANLRDLIKQIRLCKTLADERAVIQKESAVIRTSFKEESSVTRYINIEKLLYIHMLGYPAHFGQIECLKLAASPKFSDKRLAYLGIMLLLDENQETLTLVTNCLKNDMNNDNVYIVGLALCTLANIASPAMSRDLSVEVERLLGSPNSYVRKKACLTALRIIRKVPELFDHYVDSIQKLVGDKNHGVLLTAVTLAEHMCVDNLEATNMMRKYVAPLCRQLKTLVTGGSSPEHDVNGITDPFLQVKILRLLRRLGQGSTEASEQMNDVLAQVATATEGSKNVGNAVLYESVLTIMNIESDSSLRVLGVNILGKFLQNKDNNIRYVALTTLTKVAVHAGNADINALQRHRGTVIDCLKDSDISIRKRALDLAFQLITPQNIRILTRELLTYLEVCENESKSSIASRICEYAGNYRPNKRWEIDTIIRVLNIAGKYVDQGVINHFVKLVATGESSVHQYTVQKLFGLIKDVSEMVLVHTRLLQASLWCIGEYGDLLISRPTTSFGLDEGEAPHSPIVIPTEVQTVDAVVKIMKESTNSTVVREYGITALVKLSTRLKDQSAINKIQSCIRGFKDIINVEIQQRAVEYDELFKLDRNSRFALLERMPVLESALAAEELKGKGSHERSKAQKKEDLLVGDNLVGDSTSTAISTNTKSDNIMDLLGDLNFGQNPSKSPGSILSTQPVDLLGDLFGPTSTPSNQQLQSSFATLTFYDKNNLKIQFQPQKESATATQVKAIFTSQALIKNIVFQIAVPKSFKVLMQPASGNEVAPGKEVNQMFKIENLQKLPIRLRIKLSYISPSGPSEEIVDFAGFDSKLWN